MKLIQHAKQHYKTYLLFGYAFLLLVHFFIKDHFFPLSVLFYATPLPIIIVYGLILIGLLRKNKRLRILLVLGALFLNFQWIQNYYLSSKETADDHETSKIMYWNLAKKDKLPVAYISEKVAQHQPKILAFVEAPHTTLKNFEDLKTALPEYSFKILAGAMLVAAKGDIKYEKNEFVNDSHKINLLKISTEFNNYRIVITDLTASLFVNKKGPLEFLLQFSEANNVDLIVGDFNTPFESIHFVPYTENYYSLHYFNKGFTATWPIGLPLLEIDHIWISKDYKPVKLHKEYSEFSDHAMLISEFQ